jgi:chromate transporter
MMLYVRLFYEFFKVGLFAIGGGLATYPFLHELGPRTGWFTVEQLADMLAVSESTPGPIGVNMATYVGFTTSGIPGAIIATLGLVAPSIIIILLIARVLRAFRENRLVDAAFSGLRPASTGLIAAAGIGVVELALFNTDLWQQTGKLMDLFQWKAILLAVVLLVLTRWVKWTKKLHPVVFIALSAVAGIAFSFAGV